MVKKWNITIPELTGDEERRLYVYLPKSYQNNYRKRYPVLYMFDGHNLFFDSDATYGKSWGLKKYLDRTHAELIVVAIECNHAPDNGRLREYSPFTFKMDGDGEVIHGLGRTTMEWIVNELKPDVDRSFRTLSDREHTFIAGSSMGGLMSLYAVLKYNRVFSRAAALSPSVWVAPDKLNRMIKNARLKPNTVIYTDYGSEEFKNHENMEELFYSTVSRLMERHIYVTCRIIPHGTHTEANWEKQLPFVINTLLYN